MGTRGYQPVVTITRDGQEPETGVPLFDWLFYQPRPDLTVEEKLLIKSTIEEGYRYSADGLTIEPEDIFPS